MVLKRALILYLCLSSLLLANCTSSKAPATVAKDNTETGLYSREGREAQVEFSAVYISNYQSLEEYQQMQVLRPNMLETMDLPRLLTYLDGPIAYRDIGAVRNAKLTIDHQNAYMTKSGFVALKYKYEGTWLLKNNIKKAFQFPVPFNLKLIQTDKWLKCTDPEPQHQNLSFYFYFWDPSRPECDQKNGPNYQMVNVQFKEVANQTLSYPEYDRLLNSGDQKNNMQMTFAFGYVENVESPDPFTDSDHNMENFRKFLERVRFMAKVLDFQETPILQNEYLGVVRPEHRIGSRFVGIKNKIRFEIKVVAAADIDQTELFAKSFAHDHDAFTAWFGHSRVGAEADANDIKALIKNYPDFYSVSKEYQIAYWAGCTSYTYYVAPFLQMKADANPLDPKGTKGMDIVTNGYSSSFSVYEKNAMTWLGALINWDMRTNYQRIIGDLEQASSNIWRTVLTNVIGDEDNASMKAYQF